MSDDLTSTVLDLASNDPNLDDDAKLLVMAALDGDELLDQALAGTAAASAAETTEAAEAPAEVVPPAGAFLSGISVEGFRGIGPELKVPLKAGPGLTVIAGRNGSGKSTLAEALELALTGNSYRWVNRSAVWSEQWRNLHHGNPSCIRVGIAQDGVGSATLGVDWAAGAGLEDRQVWFQHTGQKRTTGHDPLGWAGPMEAFRPLLSYEEVGAILEGKPHELFDKLAGVLGLERLIDAKKRLDRKSKELQSPIAAHKAATRELKLRLGESDDPRAQAALKHLSGRNPDRTALSTIAVGSGDPAPELSKLIRVTTIAAPASQSVTAAAEALRAAVRDLADAADTASELLDDRASLLRAALTVHADHGDMQCPVCRVGNLDAAWAEQSTQLLAEQEAGLADLRTRRTSRTDARRQVDGLVTAVPDLGVSPDEELTSWQAAAEAVSQWRDAPGDDLERADHLELHIDDLTSALAALRQQATELVAARQDAWAPLATQLAGWIGHADDIAALEPNAALLKQALAWMKSNEAQLRNQRMAPLADRARAIWARLRQESNVDLGAITLDGEATRRRVTMQAEVDGAPAGALSVMSQGELQALALALFLPRATSPESPFRFIVLDDPVQAMDPAKIDGFVQVLDDLAQDRQVIVLSHDDRLPAAVRRLGVTASIQEVVRGSNSQVSVRESLHPAQRYLDDAYALAADDQVPDDVKNRVIPGLCRMALETAAHEKYTGRAYGAGTDRAAVDEKWASIHKLIPRLRLALHGDPTTSIDPWLSGDGRRKAALAVANSKVHTAAGGDHLDDVRAVRTAVRDLRAAP